MKKKRYLIAVHILFYCVMVCLTLSARAVHNASLPEVTAVYPETQYFGEGEDAAFALAIPKELCSGETLYRITPEIVNGEERSIARAVTELRLGREKGEYYEVLAGLSFMDQVITSGLETVTDGSEVLIRNEKENLE